MTERGMTEHGGPPQPNGEPSREPSSQPSLDDEAARQYEAAHQLNLDPEIAEAQLSDWQRQFRDQLAPLQDQIRELDQNIKLYQELGNDQEMIAAQLHRQELMDRRRELIEAVPYAHLRESFAVRQQLGVTMRGDSGSDSGPDSAIAA